MAYTNGAPLIVSGGPSSLSAKRRFAFFPWTSFLGLFDLKQGSSVISLFALFNKIAGVYGVLAVFTGGTLAQLSLYVYSIASIGALLWGLQGISNEDPRTVLLYSHFFIIDHLVSSVWTFYFAFLTFNAPHNGERPPLAPHQAGLMDLIETLEKEYEIPGKVLHHQPLTGEARIQGAQSVWKYEKGFATGVLLAGWLLKIFFALTLYSYALHLRHGTYASLPLAMSSAANLHEGVPERRRGTKGLGRKGSKRQRHQHLQQQRQAVPSIVTSRIGARGSGPSDSDDRVSHDWGSNAEWSPQDERPSQEAYEMTGYPRSNGSSARTPSEEGSGPHLGAVRPAGAVPAGRRGSDAFHIKAQSTEAFINPHGAGVTGVQLPGRTRAISGASATGGVGDSLSLSIPDAADGPSAGNRGASLSVSSVGLAPNAQDPHSFFSRRTSAGPAQPMSPSLPTFKSVPSQVYPPPPPS